jgi:hypothetical protein
MHGPTQITQTKEENVQYTSKQFLGEIIGDNTVMVCIGETAVLEEMNYNLAENPHVEASVLFGDGYGPLTELVFDFNSPAGLVASTAKVDKMIAELILFKQSMLLLHAESVKVAEEFFIEEGVVHCDAVGAAPVKLSLVVNN